MLANDIGEFFAQKIENILTELDLSALIKFAQSYRPQISYTRC
jgi:hypothetical protein